MSIVLVLIGIIAVLMAVSAYFYKSYSDLKESSNKTVKDLQTKLGSANTNLTEEEKKFRDLESDTKSSGYTIPVVEKMPVGAVYIDGNGTIALANKYAENYLALIPAVGKPYKEAINFMVGGNKDFTLFDAAKMGKGADLPQNAALVSQKGNIPVAGSLVPISDPTGTSVLFVFQDNSKNVERMQEEKEFFSTAAHELRTPLTGINLTTAILLKEYDNLSREKIIEYLTKTGEATEYLMSLVNNFLNLSRLDQGRLSVEKKSFNIVALTDEVIKELTPLVKQRKLFIQHEILEDAYRNVIGDPIRTKEILTNLIGNSIKYTIRGGITISHATTETKFITRITDTGNGIPKESENLLFKRFTQVGIARQQLSSKSSGLGLYISKKIAQLMRGDLILEKNDPGQGATFALSLPLNFAA